jgi:hypothetical protein
MLYENIKRHQRTLYALLLFHRTLTHNYSATNALREMILSGCFVTYGSLFLFVLARARGCRGAAEPAGGALALPADGGGATGVACAFSVSSSRCSTAIALS